MGASCERELRERERATRERATRERAMRRRRRTRGEGGEEEIRSSMRRCAHAGVAGSVEYTQREPGTHLEVHAAVLDQTRVEERALRGVLLEVADVAVKPEVEELQLRRPLVHHDLLRVGADDVHVRPLLPQQHLLHLEEHVVALAHLRAQLGVSLHYCPEGGPVASPSWNAQNAVEVGVRIDALHALALAAAATCAGTRKQATHKGLVWISSEEHN